MVMVTIEPVPEGSRLTITHAGLPSEDMRNIVTGGWSASTEQILVVLA